MPKETFKPLNNWAVIEEDAWSENIEGSVILRCEYSDDIIKFGTVKRIGPGRWLSSGHFLETCLLSGDRVLYAIDSGYPLKLDQSEEGEPPREVEFRQMTDFDCYARLLRPGEEGPCPFVPIADRIIVKAHPDNVTIGAPITRPDGSVVQLVLPETASSSAVKAYKGDVIAVGPGYHTSLGTRRKMDVEVGDVVKYSEHTGIEFKYQGEKYVIISEGNVLVTE